MIRLASHSRLLRAAAVFGTVVGATFDAGAAGTRTPDLVATYARVDTIDLKVDVHLPPPRIDSAGGLIAGDAKRPLLLWIHGGGWRGGHRGDESPAFPFLDSGFVVASIDYRLSQQATWPAQIHDAKAAVRWARAHADVLRLDTARIVAWGTSAGGQLAALLGLTTPADSLEGRVGADSDQVASVRAVIDYFGPTNFLHYVPRRWSKGSSVGQLLGCAVKDCLDRARAASPVTYVTPDDVPFFITHGTGDSTVPFAQSVSLDSALRAAGVPVLFVPIPRADHGGPSFSSPVMNNLVAGFLSNVFAGQYPVTTYGPLAPVMLPPPRSSSSAPGNSPEVSPTPPRP